MKYFEARHPPNTQYEKVGITPQNYLESSLKAYNKDANFDKQRKRISYENK